MDKGNLQEVLEPHIENPKELEKIISQIEKGYQQELIVELKGIHKNVGLITEYLEEKNKPLLYRKKFFLFKLYKAGSNVLLKHFDKKGSSSFTTQFFLNAYRTIYLLTLAASGGLLIYGGKYLLKQYLLPQKEKIVSTDTPRNPAENETQLSTKSPDNEKIEKGSQEKEDKTVKKDVPKKKEIVTKPKETSQDKKKATPKPRKVWLYTLEDGTQLPGYEFTKLDSGNYRLELKDVPPIEFSESQHQKLLQSRKQME